MSCSNHVQVVEDALTLECYIMLHRHGRVTIPMLLNVLKSNMGHLSFIHLFPWVPMYLMYRAIKSVELQALKRDLMLHTLEILDNKRANSLL